MKDINIEDHLESRKRFMKEFEDKLAALDIVKKELDIEYNNIMGRYRDEEAQIILQHSDEMAALIRAVMVILFGEHAEGIDFSSTGFYCPIIDVEKEILFVKKDLTIAGCVFGYFHFLLRPSFKLHDIYCYQQGLTTKCFWCLETGTECK